MICNIKEHNYQFDCNIRDNSKIRQDFFRLARETFDLDFEPWYCNGYWGDNYIPHVLLDGDLVVANISVNKINTCWQGQRKTYLQLGTVMTDSRYRNKGLSGWLMNTVLNLWKEQCDCIYLFANDSVLNFYPKYGFIEAKEYQHHIPTTLLPVKMEGKVRKLHMSKKEDINLLLCKYQQSNPYSALPMEHNIGLLMFYCSSFLRENVYYLEAYDSIAILEYDNDTLLCYDIFGDGTHPMEELLSAITLEKTLIIKLGFTPKQGDPYQVTPLIEEDTTLFVLHGKENIFDNHQVMLPLLSHA